MLNRSHRHLSHFAPLGRTCAMLLACCMAFAAHAQTGAGQIMAVAGNAQIIDAAGKSRGLVKGESVQAGDRIVTQQGALVQLRMADGGFISVRPGTEMVIDRFVYDAKDAGKSNFLVSLVKGGFRSITGLIGRTNPNSYQIRTATATIGIRGTDHEPMYIPIGGMGGSGNNLPGFYDKVNEGETFIKNDRGMLPLTSGQVGFAPITATKPPGVLVKVPDFYKVELKIDARPPADAAAINQASPAPAGAPNAPPGAADTARGQAAAGKGLVPTLGLTPTLQPAAGGTPGLPAGIDPDGSRLPSGLRSAADTPKARGDGTNLPPPKGRADGTNLPTPKQVAPALNGAALTPTLATSTTLSPAIVIFPAVTSPTLAPTTALAPTLSTTTIAPTLSSTNLSPTVLAPNLTTTPLAPTLNTTTVAPTLSTTAIAPTLNTTTVAPILSSTTLSTTTLSPTLTTTTTTAPTLSTTTVAPTLSTSTLSTTTLSTNKLSTTTTTLPKLTTQRLK